MRRGSEIYFNGQVVGYASQPYESINYVDAHDNETLYDLNMWKMPANSTMEDRVRMNTVSLATVTLGQSPAFWHAGTDLLRSKSMDRNSYNSGDWFNAINWTGQDTALLSALSACPTLFGTALFAFSPRRSPAAPAAGGVQHSTRTVRVAGLGLVVPGVPCAGPGVVRYFSTPLFTE